ncbi:hypothetical protein GOBAR_DD24513 [Gossypium barbadense]|nr:hypothetical protein GOBAR_DD24513 [Gossypium barbadense]
MSLAPLCCAWLARTLGIFAAKLKLISGCKTATGDGRQPGELDVEGLNGYRCKAGARISLPIRKFIGEGEMKLIWGGLVGAPDENVEGLITYKCEPMVCKLTTVGGTVCMLVAKPVEGRPKATEASEKVCILAAGPVERGAEAVEGGYTICCGES